MAIDDYERQSGKAIQMNKGLAGISGSWQQCMGHSVVAEECPVQTCHNGSGTQRSTRVTKWVGAWCGGSKPRTTTAASQGAEGFTYMKRSGTKFMPAPY